MAIQAAALANGRDPLIMAGILTMMLGLVTTASVLVGPEPHQQETAERSRPPARIVLPGAASCPLTGEDHLSRASTDHSAQPQGSPPATVVLASSDQDPREYLNKMTVLLHRRHVATATTLDPYQASLNPAVYLAGVATPTTRDDSSVRTSARNQNRC